MKDFKSTLDRLRYLIAIAERDVIENPLPHLQKAEKQMQEIMDLLEKVDYALSPDYVYDVWEEEYKDSGMRPMDIQGEALFRCNKAKKLIAEYMAK